MEAKLDKIVRSVWFGDSGGQNGGSQKRRFMDGVKEDMK